MTKQPTGPPPKRRPPAHDRAPSATRLGGPRRRTVAIAIAVVVVVGAAVTAGFVVLSSSDAMFEVLLVTVDSDDVDEDDSLDRLVELCDGLARGLGHGLDCISTYRSEWPGEPRSGVYFTAGSSEEAHEVAAMIVPEVPTVPLEDGDGTRQHLGIDHIDAGLDRGEWDCVVVVHGTQGMVAPP